MAAKTLKIDVHTPGGKKDGTVELPAELFDVDAQHRADAEYEVGQELTAEIFADGDYVDVTGTSKGKGFAGTMKRHGFSGQGASHGAQAVHRRPGFHRRLRHPGPGVQGHPDVGPDGQRPGHDAEPVGAQGRCRERCVADQGRHPRTHRWTGDGS